MDIWSFGILLYVLVTGSRFPFPHPSKKLTVKNIGEFAALIRVTPLRFSGQEWLFMSDCFKDLLTGMIEKDPEKRMTIDDVL